MVSTVAPVTNMSARPRMVAKGECYQWPELERCGLIEEKGVEIIWKDLLGACFG